MYFRHPGLLPAHQSSKNASVPSVGMSARANSATGPVCPSFNQSSTPPREDIRSEPNSRCLGSRRVKRNTGV